MESIKNERKYYFPYKLFDIEKRSNSQISIYKNAKEAPFSSPISLKNKLGIYNYSKKLKSTILSSRIFSSYMDNYTGQTQEYCFKSPSITFYPLKKNYHLLPLNARKNYNSSEENKTTNVNTMTNTVLEKPYGYKYKKTKIVINNDKKELHRSASEKLNSKIFINFSEGQHYHKILMETFGIKNIDIINCKNIIKDNFNYLKVCLRELNSIDNFTGEKEIEFKIKNFGKEINFHLKIFSICLNFYKISKEKEENNNKTNIKKLYIPFKLLPLFYLLEYSDFKNFLSEILFFDEESDSMNIKHSDLPQIINKYSLYIKKIFAQKDNNYIKSISFYKNEFHYQSNYDWIISDSNKISKRHIYKLKISFPKVKFEIKENKAKIINHLNKNILLQVLNKNFIDWEKLILYDLFSNKKFRYIMNSILIGANKYQNCKLKLFEHSSNKECNENKINNNYEFFMSDITRNKSYYYIFTPNIILLLFGNKYKFFQEIALSLKESKILYEISKYWGVINTLLKCMYKDEDKNKIYFKLNILHDFPKLAFRKTNKINSQDEIFCKVKNNNIEINDFLQYKTKSLEIIITECLLKIIQITKNEKSIFFYKMPKDLHKSIISSNSNKKVVISILQNFNEIISQEKEININHEKEKMIEKSKKTFKSPYTMEKYSIFKNPAFKSLKPTPLKTFNKMKTTTISTDKILLSTENVNAFGKKYSIFNKNKLLPKDSDKKKTAKVSKFVIQKDNLNDINEKLEKISDYYKDIFKSTSNTKSTENIKRDISQINDEGKLRKYRFSKNFIINFKKDE